MRQSLAHRAQRLILICAVVLTIFFSAFYLYRYGGQGQSTVISTAPAKTITTAAETSANIYETFKNNKLEDTTSSEDAEIANDEDASDSAAMSGSNDKTAGEIEPTAKTDKVDRPNEPVKVAAPVKKVESENAPVASETTVIEAQTYIQNVLSIDFPYNSPALPDQCNDRCKCRLVVDNKGIKCDTEDSPHPGSINYPHRLCPQNFRNLADLVFCWNGIHHNELKYASPRFEDLIACMRSGSIIYVVGWHIDAFFNNIYPLISKPFVLITGECDLTVPAHHLRFVQDSDSKVMHWFGQNGEIFSDKSVRFTQIPIGLNCFEQSRFIDETVVDLISSRSINSSLAKIQKVDSLGYDKAKTLVLNFDKTTDQNPGGRHQAWNSFCDDPKNPAQQSLRNHTGCFTKDPGVQQYFNVMKDVYKRNLQYRFWLSPKGGGIDCHRTWEALYFGRIPIMLHSAIDQMFQDLPVIIVEKWDDVTLEFLEDFWVQYIEKYKVGFYNMDKINIEYWRSKILSVSRHKSVAYLGDNFREPRCWTI